MGLDPVTWAAIGAGLLSTGAGVYNNNQTAKRQDAAAAQGIRDQTRAQAEINDRIRQSVGQLEESSAAPAAAERSGTYREQVQAAQQRALAGLQLQGASEEYAKRAGAAQEDVQGYAQRLSGLYGRMDAPTMQRQAEGFRYGDLGNQISTMARDAQGTAYLSRLRQSGIRRNPWLDVAQGALGGISSGLAGYGSAGNV
ncbi:hypothetical protein [Coralloluteibacterium thermophilus]|uniref:Uncharacterized protein n=1 Tax=Coralloluteibacterium thermophilum TaxID=2707049 RepID=A0ABV9NIX3_9GAMM